MMMLVETVFEKTTVGGQEKTDEENNGMSGALKGDNLCKEWKGSRRGG